MIHQPTERSRRPGEAVPPGRTFARRIDCADDGRRAAPAHAVPARGGGMREPARPEPHGARTRG